MKRESDFDRSFRRTNRLFWVFFCIIGALILCVWIIGGIVAFKAVNAAQGDGLKPLIESAWCGKPGCLEGGK